MGIDVVEQLMGDVRAYFGGLEDPRKGRNKKYEFTDICMAAYSIFHLQSASFLAHQDRLRNQHGIHNGQTLFGFEQIPSDNHIRQNLDKIAPEKLNGLFEMLHKNLDLQPFLAQDGLVVALDGVTFFSSAKLSCTACLTRTKEGKTRCHHAMLVPALIHPTQKCALPMAPEFITNADGVEKQDCEINASKRWVSSHKEWLSANKVTILGDDLFSRAPFIRQVMDCENERFILWRKMPLIRTCASGWTPMRSKYNYPHCQDHYDIIIRERMGSLYS